MDTNAAIAASRSYGLARAAPIGDVRRQLIATALVRLARVVDHERKLSELGDAPRDAKEIGRHERRALLAERAVSLYFCAVVCFVIAGFAIASAHQVSVSAASRARVRATPDGAAFDLDQS